MRIAVTGCRGQVAQALGEAGGRPGITVIPVGRPALDLAVPDSVYPTLAAAQPDVVVNAAAYTAVDKAESEPALAHAINGRGAGAVAEAAARLGVPIVHLSTDYVFDGTADRPYREDDPTRPLGVYGRSKRAGEQAVAAATARHIILRTAWVYAPFGQNFVRTMLRLAQDRASVSVVADQRGCPTSALDIAEAIVTLARRLTGEAADADPAAAYGLFHLCGTGEAVWADMAEAVFARSAARGGPHADVRRITTQDYPTPARRPANSRLDSQRLARVHGIVLPDWRHSLAHCVDRLVPQA